jgi:hypothetical protein
MRIMVPGIDPRSNELLVGAVAEEAFATALLAEIPRRHEEILTLGTAYASATRFRGVVARKPTVDLADPCAAGWTYLVAADDPQRDEIAKLLRPLAIRRCMREPDQPLLYRSEQYDEWSDWLTNNYWSVGEESPHFVLIVGGPDRVPFHFQALLASVASVGRLSFDNLADLQAYVEKILRLERDADPPAHRQALVFATDHGRPDPTYYGRRFLAEPIISRVADDEFPVTALRGDQATRGALLTALTEQHPAFVFTTTHGAGRPKAPLAEQMRLNGAIVCHQNELVSAADIPDDPIAEGAVIVQFACFSAGTPARSDFAHWLGDDSLNAEADFVAALPKRLLAHPRGPIAFVGHVDLTWVHAFDDPDQPDLDQVWHPRLAPFISAVQTVLDPRPVGLALADMSKRYSVGNQVLATDFDRQRRGTLPDDPRTYSRLAQAFITRSDAQNYLVLGDPAACVRMWVP